MLVMALSGFKSSGKDTVADHLINNYGFKRVSFADPLKDLVASSFKIERSWLDNPEYKEKHLPQYPAPAADGFTEMVNTFMVREFRTTKEFQADPKHIRIHNGHLQTFHNDWTTLYHTPRSLAILLGSSMRSGDANYWLNEATDKILKSSELKFVISDLRYKSEIKKLREVFGKNLITIRINRFDTSNSTDPSENDLNEESFDHVVINKGTKEELFAGISTIYNNRLLLG